MLKPIILPSSIAAGTTSTAISGLIKGDGTHIVSAIAGYDYATPYSNLAPNISCVQPTDTDLTASFSKVSGYLPTSGTTNKAVIFIPSGIYPALNTGTCTGVLVLQAFGAVNITNSFSGSAGVSGALTIALSGPFSFSGTGNVNFQP